MSSSPLAGEPRLRTGNVRVAKEAARIVDDKMRERAAASRHRSEQLSLPIQRKWFAVQRANEIEVDRIGAKADVSHEQQRRAGPEAHVAGEMRLRAAHIHLHELEVDDLLVLRIVLDEQIERAAARSRQRRIDPVDVVERNGVAANRDVVPRRTISPPHQTLPLPFPVDAGMSKCETLNQTESPSFRTSPVTFRNLNVGSYSSAESESMTNCWPNFRSLSGSASRAWLDQAVDVSSTRICGHSRRTSWKTALAGLVRCARMTLSRTAPRSESSGCHDRVR